MSSYLPALNVQITMRMQLFIKSTWYGNKLIHHSFFLRVHLLLCRQSGQSVQCVLIAQGAVIGFILAYEDATCLPESFFVFYHVDSAALARLREHPHASMQILP